MPVEPGDPQVLQQLADYASANWQVLLLHGIVTSFGVLVLQTLYTLADDQTEYQLKDRLSFMRFVGLALEDRVPDARTIWAAGCRASAESTT